MGFVEYTEAIHNELDMRTRSALNEVKVRYGRVEIRDVKNGDWCVRIVTEIGGMNVPMAALGPNLHDAAIRLLQVMQRG